MQGKKDTGCIVTHTHWDREWRYPLWENRMKLVRLMDELLDVLENEPYYHSFLLDGQCVALEDYLEVRPERKADIEKQVENGKLVVGPWYTLPDLYPIDGEALVRNLLKGIRLSKSFGKCLNVAYESFGWGQTAQFPQIYAGFGLDVVIVAKNVSKERAPESEFIWEGPDGTRLLATRLGQHGRANFFMNSYLPVANGISYQSDDYRYKWGTGGRVFHPADAVNCYMDYSKKECTEKIHQNLISDSVQVAWDAMEDTNLKSHRILMSGSDSTDPQRLLPEIIKKANESFDDINFVHTSLEEYVTILKEKLIENDQYSKLKTVKGELRDGPASSCSANALATRPVLKILNKKIQNILFKVAEPLSVMGAMIGLPYEKNFLDIASRYLLLSHPHDSINGVTQDKSVDDVLYRLNQALEIGETVINQIYAELVSHINLDGFENDDILLTIVNTSPFVRNEIIKVAVDIPQEFNIWSFDIVDPDGKVVDTQFLSRKEEVVPVDDPGARPWPFYIDRHALYMETGPVPAGGYRTYKIIPRESFNRMVKFWPLMRKSEGCEIARSSNILENEHLKVTVCPNGTIDILNKYLNKEFSSLNYLEDTGDCGDYWIYYPPYHNKTFTSLGSRARIWIEENGPLSATIASEIIMKLPSGALQIENGIRGESRRSDQEQELTVTSFYTLKSNSPKVQIRLKVNNCVEDHRMRVMFDSGLKSRYTEASGHFTVDKRPVDPIRDEQGQYYQEMQTLPMQHFVSLHDGNNSMTLLSNCFTEYEALNNEQGTLALTLFRSVRNMICTEFRSAGNFPQQKGGQSSGEHEFEYELYFHSGNWQEADAFGEAEKLNAPLRAAQISKGKGGDLPLEHGFYSLKPSTVVLSAWKKSEDRNSYIMRLFNPTDSLQEAEISLFRSIDKAYVCNLNEDIEQEIPLSEHNRIKIDIAGNKILTLEIVFKESDK